MKQISIGEKCGESSFLQQLLNLRLKPSPKLAVDANFGPQTQSAVKAFQAKSHLPVTGVVNQATWTALGQKIEMINKVTLFGQPTDKTCWSASATMLLGNVSVGNGGGDLSPSGGMLATKENVDAFAASWGLRHYAGLQPSVAAFSNFLSWTPLALRVRWPGSGGHVLVVAGMWSDGTDIGTTMLIYDPWPVGKGKVYTTPMVNARFTDHSPVASYSGVISR